MLSSKALREQHGLKGTRLSVSHGDSSAPPAVASPGGLHPPSVAMRCDTIRYDTIRYDTYRAVPDTELATRHHHSGRRRTVMTSPTTETAANSTLSPKRFSLPQP